MDSEKGMKEIIDREVYAEFVKVIITEPQVIPT